MAGEGTSTRAALRWAVLTCLLAAVTGVVCYWVGLTRAEEPTANAAPAATQAPRLVPIGEALGDVYASGRRKGKRAGADVAQTRVDRAYVRGRLDGLREGRTAARRELRKLDVDRVARERRKARGAKLRR